MRLIVLLTPNYGYNYLLNKLTHAFPDDDFLICESETFVKNRSNFSTYFKLVKKYGMAYFLCRGFEIFIVGLASRLFCGAWNPFLATTLRTSPNVEYRVVSEYDSDTFIKYVQGANVDLVISMTSHIIRNKFIDSLDIPIINLHPGLLPAYKGIAPYVWAMSNNEQFTGASFNIVDSEDLDSGAIIGSIGFSISPNESIFSAYMKCIESGLQWLILNIHLLRTRSLTAVKVSDGGSYYKWPSKQCLKLLKSNGYSIFNFRHMVRFIRNACKH